MVTTHQMKPAIPLQPFIHCYALRMIESEGSMPKTLHAQPQNYLTFLLKNERTCTWVDEKGKARLKIADRAFCSMITDPSGAICFEGSYVLFSVQFKANGLYAIFGIPQRLLVNVVVPVEDLFGNEMNHLTGLLESSVDFPAMCAHMDSYLTMKWLSQKKNAYSQVIADAGDIIQKGQGLVSIDELAGRANMSIRNFERRFVEQVGTCPKLFMRITRFYMALENKLANPEKSWTSICYDSGYFDQAHFIKECREFSSRTPDELFRQPYIPRENIVEKVEL